MKKIFKWLGIGFGVIISLIIIIIFIVLWKHNRFGYYSAGGPLSKNQAAYDITFYDINLKVDMDEKFLSGYTKVIIKTLDKKLTKIELDLLDHFDVKGITLENQEISFEHDNHKLWLLPITQLEERTSYNFKIEYSGNPVEAIIPPWIDGFNWSEDSSGSHWVGLSSQGSGGKLWFPSKDSQSDKPDSVSINITIPKEYFC
ncbi:MAG: M1 family metallopeptidase, partial [Ignavibacteriae bacterium]|nr:M1 family metallopeptidase [Ignavibacteriota bacterium]